MPKATAGPCPPPLSPSGLRRFLDSSPPAARVFVAYSGGLDSTVLLHLCHRLRPDLPAVEFTAVHVHHGLQSAAEDFAAHCGATCTTLDLPLRLLRVDARPRPGESPEAAARAARYGALAELLAPGDLLLTGQHRDDQAETLLLHLLRGSGVAGLAAMPARAELGRGRLLRPLLEITRAELRAYAARHGLDWIDDPSNEDTRYDRNFIRRRVMPVLLERWPGAVDTLSRSARHCAEAEAAVSSLAADLLHSFLDRERDSLPVDRLLALPAPDLRRVLRQWLRARGFRSPPAQVLERVRTEALPARPDRNPRIVWPEGEIRRFRNELFLLAPEPPFDAAAIVPWSGAEPLHLPEANGLLHLDSRPGPGLSPDLGPDAAITVRYRQGGEALRPAGRAGTHELKKLLQEAGLPPWVRDRIPLLYVGGSLAAVPGRWVAAEFAGPRDGRQRVPVWDPPARLGTWWQPGRTTPDT